MCRVVLGLAVVDEELFCHDCRIWAPAAEMLEDFA
jgi:hypothetical protein